MDSIFELIVDEGYTPEERKRANKLAPNPNNIKERLAAAHLIAKERHVDKSRTHMKNAMDSGLRKGDMDKYNKEKEKSKEEMQRSAKHMDKAMKLMSNESAMINIEFK